MGKLNIKPRTIFCRDNLDILRGINADCIDLIYLDPPFNKKKNFTAPIGSSAEGASFRDIFTMADIKDDWVKSIEYENPQLHSYLLGVKTFSNQYNYCYLVYMAIRLIECHRVLKDSGSVYLHCDPTMSHYLKIVLDCIFGEKHFLNEVIWSYKSGGTSKNHFSRKHDIVFFYAKSSRYNFIPQKEKSYNRDFKPYRFKGVAEYRDDVGFHTLVNMKDVWNIDMVGRTSAERTGYPTQKPLELLLRIIRASSKENDIVLDPFCGCATTCVAAEKLGRQWVGVDVSKKAHDLVIERLKKAEERLLNPDDDIHFTTVAPKRGADETREKGYVYIIGNDNWQGVYKVGIAKNVTQRLNSFQTSDPYRAYRLLYQLHTPHYRAIEKHIHKKFAATTAHEWVQADITAIKKEIQTHQQKLNKK